MSEVLTPAALRGEVKLLVAELVKLVQEYEVAHGVAYSPQVVETANVAADHSNVPHSMADQNARLRGELRTIGEMIRRFRAGTTRRDGSMGSPGVEQQVDWLTAALEGSERRHGPRFDLVRNPRSLSADGSELEKLKEAQRRRQERGETA